MALLPQALVVLCGCPFTGKTELGDALRKELDIPFLAVDRIRHVLYGKTEFDLAADMRQLSRAYPAMRGAADAVLATGDSVIIEGTFSRRAYQEDIINYLCARHQRLHAKIILLIVPEDKEQEEISKRVALRSLGNPSAARTISDYLRVRVRFEPIVLPHIVLDTTERFEETFQKAIRYVTAPAL